MAKTNYTKMEKKSIILFTYVVLALVVFPLSASAVTYTYGDLTVSTPRDSLAFGCGGADPVSSTISNSVLSNDNYCALEFTITNNKGTTIDLRRLFYNYYWEDSGIIYQNYELPVNDNLIKRAKLLDVVRPENTYVYHEYSPGNYSREMGIAPSEKLSLDPGESHSFIFISEKGFDENVEFGVGYQHPDGRVEYLDPLYLANGSLFYDDFSGYFTNITTELIDSAIEFQANATFFNTEVVANKVQLSSSAFYGLYGEDLFADFTGVFVNTTKSGGGNDTVLEDQTGNGHDGTLMNGMAKQDIDVMTGSFSWTSDPDTDTGLVRVLAHDDFNITTNEVTYAFWIKHVSDGALTYYIHQPFTFGGHVFLRQASNRMYVNFASTTGWNSLGSNALVSTSDGWTHVVATHNGTTQRIYIDGVLDNERNQTIALYTYSNNVMGVTGWWSGTMRGHNGSMDDFRIFDRALDSTEVNNLYNGGSGDENYLSSDSNLIIQLTAEEGTGINLDKVDLVLPDWGGTPNASTIRANNTVHFYPFNGSGDDYGPGNVDLTLNDLIQIDGYDGEVNGAYYYGGDFNYSESSSNLDSSLGGSNDRTISLWYNCSGDNAGSYLLDYGPNAGSGRAFKIRIYSDYRIGFSTVGGARYWNLPIGWNNSQWHNFALKLNGTLVSDLSAYLDGVLLDVNSTSDVTLDTLLQHLYLGISNTGTWEFTGGIDEVAFFNYSLSNSEILDIYNNGIDKGVLGQVPSPITGTYNQSLNFVAPQDLQWIEVNMTQAGNGTVDVNYSSEFLIYYPMDQFSNFDGYAGLDTKDQIDPVLHLTGNAGWNNINLNGKFYNASTFAGSSQYFLSLINDGNQSKIKNNLANDMTLRLWVNDDGDQGDSEGWAEILQRNITTGEYNRVMSVGRHEGGGLTIVLNREGVNEERLVTTDIPGSCDTLFNFAGHFGNWTLVEFVKDDSARTVEVYVNNTLKTTCSYSNSFVFVGNAEQYRIQVGFGRTVDSFPGFLGENEGFQGSIDDLQVISRKTTAPERATYWNSQMSLIDYYTNLIQDPNRVLVSYKTDLDGAYIQLGNLAKQYNIDRTGVSSVDVQFEFFSNGTEPISLYDWQLNYSNSSFQTSGTYDKLIIVNPSGTNYVSVLEWNTTTGAGESVSLNYSTDNVTWYQDASGSVNIDAEVSNIWTEFAFVGLINSTPTLNDIQYTLLLNSTLTDWYSFSGGLWDTEQVTGDWRLKETTGNAGLKKVFMKQKQYSNQDLIFDPEASFGEAGLIFHYSNVADTGYYLEYDATDGLTLYRNDGGTLVLLGTESSKTPITSDTTFLVRFTGNVIVVATSEDYTDYTQRIQVIDATYGVGGYSGFASNSSSTEYFDDLYIQALDLNLSSPDTVGPLVGFVDEAIPIVCSASADTNPNSFIIQGKVNNGSWFGSSVETVDGLYEWDISDYPYNSTIQTRCAVTSDIGLSDWTYSPVYTRTRINQFLVYSPSKDRSFDQDTPSVIGVIAKYYNDFNASMKAVYVDCNDDDVWEYLDEEVNGTVDYRKEFKCGFVEGANPLSIGIILQKEISNNRSLSELGCNVNGDTEMCYIEKNFNFVAE